MSIFKHQLSSLPGPLIFPDALLAKLLEVACSRVVEVKATPARGQPLLAGGHSKDEGKMLDEFHGQAV